MSKTKAYRSPLFYVGDKYKLFPKISKYFPQTIDRFIEPFTGGGSVFMNVKAKEYFLNDIDTNVINIHKYLISNADNQTSFFHEINKVIEKYGLSHSYIKDIVPQSLKNEWKKTYYAKFNKTGFNKLKKDYNKSEDKEVLILYLMLIYGFNRMLRFNSKGEYNLPVGNVDFNRNVYDALTNYFAISRNRNLNFLNLDYIDFFKQIKFQENDFVYIDPPYLITFSEYNKLWNEETEKKLIAFIDYLADINVNFAISNVTHYKGEINELFLNWSEKYNVQNIKSNYISYHDNTIKEFNEVLVYNYGKTAIDLQTLTFHNNSEKSEKDERAFTHTGKV
ncbi:MAG: Dam family site-specific DNA-(adenine-N6)-methyltransferase [Bacteroidales bacterium]|nr:Dam family site-specific DNA-(adenine-N6)-methyltransferase [Bacteroidales bacterium]